MKLIAITLILLSISQAGTERASLPEKLYMADRAYIEAVEARDAQSAGTALRRVAELGAAIASPSGHYEELDLSADMERAISAGLDLDLDAPNGAPIPWRGRRGGPSQTHHLLEQGGLFSEQAVYVGGELAAVYARTTRPVPVRLIIVSSDGDNICDETSSEGRALCTWRPEADQQVDIQVVSNGREHTELRLFSN